MTVETPRAATAKANGYWTPERLQIWSSLTPEQRDYDRYQGWYPPGQGECETPAGRQAIDQREEARDRGETGCSCPISPPCSYCTDSKETL